MSTVTRRPDWEDRLHAWIERSHARPHRWGSHDCLMFGAGGVRAMTGFDPAQGHRGKYRSQASAFRYLRTLGHGSPEQMADSLFPRIAPAMAQRGDWVLHQNSIGLCMGPSALFVGLEVDGTAERAGLVRVPMADCTAAWKIG